MKNTMNNRDIASYHKMLKAKESLSNISNILKVSKDTLAKFTPEKVADAKDKGKAKAEEIKKTDAKVAQVATIAAKAAIKATIEKA